MGKLGNILRLGIKELYSLRHDAVMLSLILFCFTLSVYTAAEGVSHDLNSTSVAIVDEDRSQLSARLRDALLAPAFKEPALISFKEIDPGMDTGLFTFVIVIPSRFEADLLAGRRPAVQINIDATAIMQAGTGDRQISAIIEREIATFVNARAERAADPVELTARYAFNPNITSSWFTSVMELINNITMLSIILTGAALIREREHGTIEHLLVMPLTPFEIVMAKVWANGAVILAASGASLWLVVEQLLGVAVAGSMALFLLGTVAYLFFATALGIILGTLARSMPQFGLLFMLVVLPMNLLSGGQTPLEAQPPLLQAIMQAVPSTQYVSTSQAILFRGAGLDVVWLDFLVMFGVGGLFFAFAAAHFRGSIAVSRA